MDSSNSWIVQSARGGGTVRRRSLSLTRALIGFSLIVLSSCATSRGAATGWTWLPHGHSAETGFGMYSYVLFAKPPQTDYDEKRYEAVLTALMGSTAPVGRMTEPRNSINVTYIPVRYGMTVVTMSPSESAKSALEFYDYEAARNLLNLCSDRMQRPLFEDGPYIFSSSSPISTQSKVEVVLIQNLTRTTPDNVEQWVNEFMQRAYSSDFRKPDSIEHFALELRNAISVSAIVFGDIADWIGLFKPKA